MIQVAHPWALLSLASLPLILALYSLRPSRRPVVVSSTSLWQEALRENRQGLGLQNLLRNLSLLLLLLLALALSLGLAGPTLITEATESRDTVLVLDVSASMQTTGPRGTRFDAAKQMAAGIIGDLPDGARMLLMTSGRAPVLRSAFEGDSATLARQLAPLEATDEAGAPREALALALSLLRDRENGRVYFITDAAYSDDLDLGTSSIEVIRIGEPARNVAITRFDVRPEFGVNERFQILLTVRNYSDEDVVVPARITLDRAVVLDRELQLEPRAKQTLVVPIEGKASGAARALIEPDDELDADNRAFAVLGTDEPLRIALIGQGNYYLESAFSAMPNVEFTRLDADVEDELAHLARTHDVIVFDGVAAPLLPPGNYLLIDTAAPNLPFEIQGSVTRPAIQGKGASALVRNADLSGVRIDEARRISIDDTAANVQKLFWSEETVLALALLQSGVRAVYLGFDLRQSTLPLQAAFPVLLDESLSWLRPRTSRFTRTQLKAGESHTLTVPEANSELIMRLPSGEATVLALAPAERRGGTLAFNDTSKSGIYTYIVGDVRRYFAVNLTDGDESDINPSEPPPATQARPTDARVQGQITTELWPYLIVLALGLAVLEWIVWSGGRRLA